MEEELIKTKAGIETSADGGENLITTKWRDEEFRKIRLAFFNILEDTEEAKKEAEKEKNKTLDIINNLTDGILVLDEDNKIELFNPLAISLFKKKDGNLIDQSIFKINSDGLDLAPLHQVLKGSKKEKIKHFLRKEINIGNKFFLQVSSVPFNEKNEKKETLLILHDISKDKLIESMKTEFVSIAAHQLRTPLSAIKWTIQMLLDGDIGAITAEQKELLQKTYESNERMILLINDLLNATKIEEGDFSFNLKPLQLEEIINIVIKNTKDFLDRKKINLKFEKLATPLSKVLIDKEKMELAVQNLLENAIKYTLSGGEITIFLKEEGSQLVFKIQDTGVGIPKDQQDRIFTKFFRGSNAIRLETEGSGLGLYTAKNIIMGHNGDIWFESEEGKGTIFYFSLPIVKKNP